MMRNACNMYMQPQQVWIMSDYVKISCSFQVMSKYGCLSLRRHHLSVIYDPVFFFLVFIIIIAVGVSGLVGSKCTDLVTWLCPCLSSVCV